MMVFVEDNAPWLKVSNGVSIECCSTRTGLQPFRRTVNTGGSNFNTNF